ncbi:copper resistance protein NlpE [Acinetobacter qingfengensis]|uniref:Uncharacterized protein n=1 Tax=Acinetobacter qingfengensis TaxID=1262585 RepID=A0A1E7RCH6_9GAMM|nr:copper resistance protein NlpE [Acinetobacter qingfengensis]KAA8735113.1 copper resistance protein NlpE [Acinetobacter qingfengensis]OEY97074.1 hypothetical protein BJI46_10965 [Acinetobacter qingfengensis]
MNKSLLPILSITAALILVGCNSANQPQNTQLSENQQSPLSQQSHSDTAHTAENALDWDGIYQGTLPCADCPGIKTVLTLHADKTYKLEETYLERNVQPIITEGTFQFDKNQSSIITLDSASQNRKFFIGENFANALDLEGNPITGALQQYYKLNKVQ